MKLFYAPTSPYARKARIAVRELGLEARVEEIECALRTPDNPVLRYSPAGRVPTLVTEDGRVLVESAIVCAALDALAGGGRLYPREPQALWEALEVDGLATVLLDSLAGRARELRRPEGERSPGFLRYEADRCRACYDGLEGLAPRLDGAVTIAQVTVGATLGHADFRQPGDRWREGRGRLAAWYGRFATRDSMRATAPPGEPAPATAPASAPRGSG